MGEWQWFCLPLIAIPSGIIGKVVGYILSESLPPRHALTIIAWSFGVMIIVALLLGYCVSAYAALPKGDFFRVFYAVSYFLSAFALAAFLVAIFAGQGADIFARLFGILIIYGFIVSVAGIVVMKSKVKQYK